MKSEERRVKNPTAKVSVGGAAPSPHHSSKKQARKAVVP